MVSVLLSLVIILSNTCLLGDAKKLLRDFGTEVRSCVELSFLAVAVDPSRFRVAQKGDLIALKKLVRECLGKNLPKNSPGKWDGVLTRQHITCMFIYLSSLHLI